MIASIIGYVILPTILLYVVVCIGCSVTITVNIHDCHQCKINITRLIINYSDLKVGETVLVKIQNGKKVSLCRKKGKFINTVVLDKKGRLVSYQATKILKIQ